MTGEAINELVGALQDVEWSGEAPDPESIGDTISACPWCGAAQEDSAHHVGCRLSKALDLAAEEKGGRS